MHCIGCPLTIRRIVQWVSRPGNSPVRAASPWSEVAEGLGRTAASSVCTLSATLGRLPLPSGCSDDHGPAGHLPGAVASPAWTRRPLARMWRRQEGRGRLGRSTPIRLLRDKEQPATMSIPLRDHKMLWGRAGARCSFCRTLLASISDIGLASVIGEEAHIVARSVNGPRGESSLSAEQRNAYSNLILLCPTHHAVIASSTRPAG